MDRHVERLAGEVIDRHVNARAGTPTTRHSAGDLRLHQLLKEGEIARVLAAQCFVVERYAGRDVCLGLAEIPDLAGDLADPVLAVLGGHPDQEAGGRLGQTYSSSVQASLTTLGNIGSASTLAIFISFSDAFSG